MKEAFLFTLLLLLALPVGYGQKAKRPTETWRLFTSPDESFRVLLPGPPKEDVSGKFTLGGLLAGEESHRYVSSSGSEKYLVGFKDFSTQIDEGERKATCELMFPSLPDKQVFVGPHSGVETTEELWGLTKTFGVDHVKAVYRVFIIDQRLFLLAAIVPADTTPLKKRRYRAKIDKFFDSFKPLQTNFGLKARPSILPKDYGITLDQENFRSSVLGLSIQVPAGWRTEIHQPNGEMWTMEYKYDDGATDRQKILYATKDSPLSELTVTVEQPESANTTLSEFVQKRANVIGRGVFSLSESVQERANYAGEIFFSRHAIGGREFLMIERTRYVGRSGPFTTRRYYTEWNGYVLEVGMLYEDESGRDALEKSLRTLTVLNNKKF